MSRKVKLVLQYTKGYIKQIMLEFILLVLECQENPGDDLVWHRSLLMIDLKNKGLKEKIILSCCLRRIANHLPV